MTEQDRVNEFVRRFIGAGREPGNPHEGIDVPTVRQIVREVWNDQLDQLDAKILELSRCGVIGLHEHDYPPQVKDQSTLLWAGGSAFCLVCLLSEYRR